MTADPSEKSPQERTTKYIAAVKAYLAHVGHASNAEILAELQSTYPSVSATTVHRITTRLLERQELLLAPSDATNSMRYDNNTAPHDHFSCLGCGILKDADIHEQLRPIVEQAVGDGCSISGRLIVSGYCKRCAKTSQASP